ncbi:hypothetical protein F1645_16390 (plasmid) [Novacetimonas hansenii]|uniref:Uncharacterized protein n=1 Tax=Novacetimonas hansenii TaxID=436 RepID=A0ABQ0SFW5_NOVHA|nr:hypothetical protein [Novacetimonas hansenii]GAN83789.1 hypothetical protein Gaha_0105_024 [Novacetimonas hansenii JCM 7643]GBQ63051.1 hypothetical protein AA0243_3022 [Novacetimonas hansenii NRIC 0243]GEC64194.1 hypothetical protein GHA01_20430 [Novacetimonas hansenii]
MATVETYAVYLTTATGTNSVGYVVDNVLWDGASAWTPPEGTAVVADPDRKYPIGSTYDPATSTTT